MASVKLTLNKSGVRFDEGAHTYSLDGRQLSGITTLIRDVVGLGYHGEVPQFILDRAAEYGTAVHHAIEMLDTKQLCETSIPRSPQFVADGQKVWDVSQELANYNTHRRGYKAIANEYTVSDNAKYASQIDIVWQDEDNNIWLVDTKTNNIESYPGGRSHWLEYLSWQLSIYAVLFERQNPHLNVKGLLCNWLRHENHELITIERLPDDKVNNLLMVDYDVIDGRIVFDEMSASIAGYSLHTDQLPQRKEASTVELIAQDTINLIAQLKTQELEIKAKMETLNEKLREAMQANNVEKWQNDRFIVTLSKDSETTTLDTAKLKKEKPELYNQYSKITQLKGALKITLL